jgi:hypothetical protein
MEKQQNQAGMVLQYDRRRYDGGPEIEQIRLIETQQAMLQQAALRAQEMGQWHAAIPAVLPDGSPVVTAPGGMPNVEAAPPMMTPAPAAVSTPAGVQAPVKAPSSRGRKIQEAILLGPFSLCVGAVGILTALLALAVAQRMRNPALLEQGRTVLRECGRTVRKGLLDTVNIPARLFMAATARC